MFWPAAVDLRFRLARLSPRGKLCAGGEFDLVLPARPSRRRAGRRLRRKRYPILQPEKHQSMNLELDNKVVLISGGAKGIGAAIARAVAQERAIPVLVDRDAAAGKDLLARLASEKSTAHFIEADLCSSAGCQSAVERALALTRRLDAVVNNAGVNDRVGLEGGNPAQFVASLERNLLHYYHLAHYALPALKETKGSIVNIASKVALTGQGGTSGYAASKGAILALTREWSVELLPFGIRVNAVVPAEVLTPLYRQWLDTF